MTKGAPKTALIKGKNWLPFHRAQLYFFPEFAETGEAFCNEVSKIIARIEPTAVIEKNPLDPVVCVTISDVSLKIYGGSGDFSIGPAWSDDIDQTISKHDDPIGLPDDFFDECGRVDFKPEHEAAATALIRVAERLWRSLQSRFTSAVRSGTAEIVGRCREIDAPFSALSIDQLNYMSASIQKIENDLTRETETTTMLGPNRARLLSVHVRPHRVQATLTNKAERACEELLISLMHAAAPRVRRKEELLNSVRQEWSKKQISDRSFQTIYRRAISLAKIEGYGKPGAKRKSIHRT